MSIPRQLNLLSYLGEKLRYPERFRYNTIHTRIHCLGLLFRPGVGRNSNDHIPVDVVRSLDLTDPFCGCETIANGHFPVHEDTVNFDREVWNRVSTTI